MSLSLNEIKKHAKSVGINSLDKFKKKGDLIHAIQKAEGCSTCFDNLEECGERNCKWYADCQNPN